MQQFLLRPNAKFIILSLNCGYILRDVTCVSVSFMLTWPYPTTIIPIYCYYALHLKVTPWSTVGLYRPINNVHRKQQNITRFVVVVKR